MYSTQVEREDVVEDAPAAAYGEELECLVEVHWRCVIDGNLACHNDENTACFCGLTIKAFDLMLCLCAKRLQTLENGLWTLELLLLHCEHALRLLLRKNKQKREHVKKE